MTAIYILSLVTSFIAGALAMAIVNAVLERRMPNYSTASVRTAQRQPVVGPETAPVAKRRRRRKARLSVNDDQAGWLKEQEARLEANSRLED